MVLAALSWGWIGIASFLCGFAVLQGVFGRGRKGYWQWDTYLMAGLCVLSVYAQIFSLFHRVSALAVFLLGGFCLTVCVGYRKSLAEFAGRLIKGIRLWKVLVFLALFVAALCLTVEYASQYDTGLYHAQSIRWIEEYGAVPGLGNLHNRLAYNSAFFCLQALFGLKFAVNQSLHTLNGFLVFVMLFYGISTSSVFGKKRMAASDWMKLGLVIYLCTTEVNWTMSSPGSDISVLTLVLYICAKWCEALEEKGDVIEFGLLSLLAVWAVTLKLSAGAMVILAVYPAAELIRRKRWKLAGLFAAAGAAILLPFLARNVVLSGYLIYPYASVDLFDVDWKMNANVLEYDSKEIMAWGRGQRVQEQYDAPFGVWFPAWFGELSLLYRILFAVNLPCLAGAAVYLFRCARGKGNPGRGVLALCCAGGLLLWFFSAPLIRYGMIYMILLPLLFLGMLTEKLGKNSVAAPVIGLAMAWFVGGMWVSVIQDGLPPAKRPCGYFWHNVRQVELEGVDIYVPEGSDQAGYHYFPSTPYPQVLERIELRTGRLEDGFRLREEYRDAKLTGYGGLQE